VISGLSGLTDIWNSIMSPVRFGPAVLLVAVCACLPLRAEQALPGPNWTHGEIRQAAAEADLLETLRPLLELARTRQDTQLLQALQRLAADDSLPLPARERALFEFAVNLSDMDRLAVGPGVLEFLRTYQPRVLVPHEDSRQLGIPMYNIPAAAAGVLHEWQWQAGAAEAITLKAAPVEDWLAAYRSAEPARRSGYLDHLDEFSEPALRSLAQEAAKQLANEPNLTPVVSRAAVLLLDVELLQRTITLGTGPGLAMSLRAAAAELDEPERAELLNHAVLNAPAANAALVIAELTPGLLHRPETITLLTNLLGDPDLGAASALAVSRSPSQAVRAQLKEIAGQDRGMASRRAALAATLARDNADEAER